MKRLFVAVTTVAILVASAAIVGPALASRKPDHDEAVAITKAFKTTKLAGLNKVANRFNVVQIKVSTVNPSYATAGLKAKPQFRSKFQSSIGVAKLSASKTWKAIDVGTSGVGCKTVPKNVRKDLGLNPCPA